MTKPTKWHVRPAKTQISLGICEWFCHEVAQITLYISCVGKFDIILIIIYHSMFGQRDWGLSGWVGEGGTWVGMGKDGLKSNFDHLNFT